MLPIWYKTLGEVLKHETEKKTLKSKKGEDYETDVISKLRVLSTGSFEQTPDGQFRYSIVDSSVGLEYAIKVPQKLDVKFGSIIEFRNVRGGETNRGGWYAAESASIEQRNA